MLLQTFKSRTITESLGFKLLLLAMFLALSVNVLVLGSASAEPAPSNPVKNYCMEVLPRDLERACTTKLIDKVRKKMADGFCKDVQTKGGKKERCIERNSKAAIKKAATDPRPNDANDFRNRLDDAVEEENNPGPTKGSGSTLTDPNSDPNDPCSAENCDLIKKYVNPAINLLTVAFGIIAVASIIMGGIQYTASTGDPQKVTAAKQRITNTIIAVVAYFFLYGFLQFLIPGGAFNR